MLFVDWYSHNSNYPLSLVQTECPLNSSNNNLLFPDGNTSVGRALGSISLLLSVEQNLYNLLSAMSSHTSLFRRYRWERLTEPEREAVRDCMSVAGTRMVVGMGAVLTAAALFGHARRGKRPLPPGLRYGAGGFFTLAGGYVGLISGGPMYAARILAVPNSKFADELRVVAGDWQSQKNVPTVTREEFESAKRSSEKEMAQL